MNPIRLLKIYKRASRLLGLFEEAQVSKSLFASKTFWANVLSAGLELSNVLPIPPGYLLLGTNLVNIVLRMITDKPVHLIAPSS